MYKNYIFDLYGTLIDIKTNEESEQLWDKLSLFYCFNGAKYTSLELRQSYLEEVKKNLSSINNTIYPDFPIEKVFTSLYKVKNINPCKQLIEDTSKLFRILSIEHLSLYNGVTELLKLLRSKNKNIYLLSNAQRIFTLHEMKSLDIYKYFNKIYFSSDCYVCKPDRNFYYKLLDSNDLNIKETIMIGNDFLCDIEGANNLGIDTLYIESNLSPIAEFNINSTYSVMDGDINKISRLIIK